MADFEHKGQLTKIDENGDKHILYPETEIDCVHGLNDALSTHAEDKNNPHGVTIAQIGAAPSGYGLGGAPSYINDCNTVTYTGWYKWDTQAANAPFSNGIMQVIGRSKDISALQIAYMMLASNVLTVAMRRIVKSTGNYEEWEYINPTMLLGKEYRTTERWNGKVVYTKLIYFGTMPNKTTLYTSATEKVLPVGAKNVQLNGFAYKASVKEFYPIPCPGVEIWANTTTNAQYIGMKTDDDWSSYEAYIIAKYTKD